ncbi:MAG: hypothetical protein ACREJP_07255 [Candidatus Methylomirabilales bacterium]
MIEELPGLEPLRSFTNPQLGIRERFLTPMLGGARSVAILSTPIEKPRSLGWVICPPFGIEQTYLYPLEVETARRLAASGFPTLRFHSQGYGDSELPSSSATLDSHTRDAREAVQLLLDEAEVNEFGLLGGFIGGSVAAIVGDEMGASALAMWHPVVDGEKYVRRLFRTWILENLTRSGRNAPAGGVWKIVREHGSIAIHGFPVRRATLEGFASFNLIAGLNTFRGSALITQVSNRDKHDGDLDALRRRFDELGASAQLDSVQDAAASRFGFDRYALKGWGDKVDTQGALSRTLIDRLVNWVEGLELGPRQRTADATP